MGDDQMKRIDEQSRQALREIEEGLYGPIDDLLAMIEEDRRQGDEMLAKIREQVAAGLVGIQVLEELEALRNSGESSVTHRIERWRRYEPK